MNLRGRTKRILSLRKVVSTIGHFRISFASFSKRSLVLNYSHEKDINLSVNENLKSYERMSTRSRFENEADGDSEIAYYIFYILKCSPRL